MKKQFSAFFFLSLLFAINLPAIAADVTKSSSIEQQLASQSTLPEIKRAAEAGDPDAQYALGYLYYYGRGVPQDIKLAKQWIKKAANQGQQQAVQAEKILLGTVPSIQPKVNPILQPNGESPDKPHAPVPGRQEMKKAPVVVHDQKAVSNIVETEKPVLQQKTISSAKNVANPVAPVKVANPQSTTKNASKAPPAKEIKVTPTPTTQKSTSAQKFKDTKGKSYFTIQLLSSSSKQDVMRFIAKSQLKQASYYETYRNGQKWYVVVHGKYPSRQAASAAIKKLPESIKKNGPWVKSSQWVDKEISKKQ